MASLETFTRMALSARSVVHWSPVVQSRRLPPFRSSLPQEGKDKLSQNFRRLAISPAEAQMTSQLLTSARTLTVPECRLPPLVKPVTITIPSLYNGVHLEKDLPSVINIMEKIEPLVPQQIVEAPATQVVEKQAARLIVIRRRKMRRHKLKKLRKKMKFLWQKVRQKREYRKEKLFQATQMTILRKLESFDAAEYVGEVLKRAKEKPIPRTWNGKRLPQPVIQRLLEEEEAKKMRRKMREEQINRMRKELQ